MARGARPDIGVTTRPTDGNATPPEKIESRAWKPALYDGIAEQTASKQPPALVGWVRYSVFLAAGCPQFRGSIGIAEFAGLEIDGLEFDLSLIHI